jgi:hypothetical protein
MQATGTHHQLYSRFPIKTARLKLRSSPSRSKAYMTCQISKGPKNAAGDAHTKSRTCCRARRNENVLNEMSAKVLSRRIISFVVSASNRFGGVGGSEADPSLLPKAFVAQEIQDCRAAWTTIARPSSTWESLSGNCQLSTGFRSSAGASCQEKSIYQWTLRAAQGSSNTTML